MSGTRPRATRLLRLSSALPLPTRTVSCWWPCTIRPAPLTVGSVEAFLNDFLPSHPEASVDYIHGSSTAMALASRPGQKAAAILLPDLAKADLFKGVVLGGVLPRKTFSMGHAEEKRYYNECRAID